MEQRRWPCLFVFPLMLFSIFCVLGIAEERDRSCSWSNIEAICDASYRPQQGKEPMADNVRKNQKLSSPNKIHFEETNDKISSPTDRRDRNEYDDFLEMGTTIPLLSDVYVFYNIRVMISCEKTIYSYPRPRYRILPPARNLHDPLLGP